MSSLIVDFWTAEECFRVSLLVTNICLLQLYSAFTPPSFTVLSSDFPRSRFSISAFVEASNCILAIVRTMARHTAQGPDRRFSKSRGLGCLQPIVYLLGLFKGTISPDNQVSSQLDQAASGATDN